MSVDQPGRIHSSDVETTVESRETFSMAKAAAFILGAFNIIVGVVALVRVGFDSPSSETTTVAGLRMTAILALAHLILGVLALAGATQAALARSTLATVGAVLLIAGIIALIQNISALGWTSTNGIVYVVMGVIALVVGMISPEGFYSRRSVGTRHYD